jgi:hypothetical protein
MCDRALFLHPGVTLFILDYMAHNPDAFLVEAEPWIAAASARGCQERSPDPLSEHMPHPAFISSLPSILLNLFVLISSADTHQSHCGLYIAREAGVELDCELQGMPAYIGNTTTPLKYNIIHSNTQLVIIIAL